MAVEKTSGGERVVFTRPDPTEHALLVCKLGAHHGNVKETANFKPAGTEWAREQDLADAGYVPEKWQEAAYRMFKYVISLTIAGGGTREPIAILESIVGRPAVDEFHARLADEVAEAAREAGKSFEAIGAATGSIGDARQRLP